MVGLVVIVIVIVYALIARVMVRFFTDDIEPKSRGSTWRLVGYAIAATLPFADALYGSARLAIACATEARAEVSRNVEISSAYFSADGRFLAIDKYGSIRWDMMSDYFERKIEYSYLPFSQVQRLTTRLISKGSSSEIGRQVDFLYGGGLLPKNASGQGFGSGSCGPQPDLEYHLKSRLVRSPDGATKP